MKKTTAIINLFLFCCICSNTSTANPAEAAAEAAALATTPDIQSKISVFRRDVTAQNEQKLETFKVAVKRISSNALQTVQKILVVIAMLILRAALLLLGPINTLLQEALNWLQSFM